MARGGISTSSDKARSEAEALFVRGPSHPAAGAGAKKPQYLGAIVLQPAAALDAFVRVAQAGNEFVYCEAPEPQRTAEGWLRAGELARAGLVRTHERLRPGGGRIWFVVRTGKALPKALSAQSKALADRATEIIFTALKRAANFAQPCPSDAALAEAAGLNTRAQAQGRFRELVRVALIESQLAYESGVPYRVVTILPGKHAGAAAGKCTALPRKWRALKEAAEKDLRAADDADLTRLRRAGL